MLEAGDPGWAGERVLLVRLGADGVSREVLAAATLGDAGAVEIDDPELAERWSRDGIVGRAEVGRLFPRDGQAFLDELPFIYRGAHLRAVPAEHMLEGGV